MNIKKLWWNILTKKKFKCVWYKINIFQRKILRHFYVKMRWYCQTMWLLIFFKHSHLKISPKSLFKSDFVIRDCSHILSAKKGGSRPPPTLVSQKLKIGWPPSIPLSKNLFCRTPTYQVKPTFQEEILKFETK